MYLLLNSKKVRILGRLKLLANPEALATISHSHNLKAHRTIATMSVKAEITLLRVVVKATNRTDTRALMLLLRRNLFN